MPVRIGSIQELTELIQKPLEPSSALTLTQKMVGRFADLTLDHQPVNLDQEAARVAGYPRTIVQDMFLLSLLPGLLPQVLDLSGFAAAMYVPPKDFSFGDPVPVGQSVTLRAMVLGYDPMRTSSPETRVRAIITGELVVDDLHSTPVLKAEMRYRLTLH